MVSCSVFLRSEPSPGLTSHLEQKPKPPLPCPTSPHPPQDLFGSISSQMPCAHWAAPRWPPASLPARCPPSTGSSRCSCSSLPSGLFSNVTFPGHSLETLHSEPPPLLSWSPKHLSLSNGLYIMHIYFIIAVSSDVCSARGRSSVAFIKFCIPGAENNSGTE